ncbi:MAG: DUF501 domain-containing protein [Synergistaceae bacterium]|nr:DUF501 domain-containing protein [Synergistaceae bacterium]
MMKVNSDGRCFGASPVFVAGEKLCRFSHVQVQICRPFGKKYKPFPTTFWLVCPYLVKRAGMIESSGGVHELEEYIVSNGLVHEWRRYNLLHQALRLRLGGERTNDFLRRFRRRIFRDVVRGGVGGIRVGEGVNVKCLHLQTASLLGIGRHPAGEWLKSRGLRGDCGYGLCGKE